MATFIYKKEKNIQKREMKEYFDGNTSALLLLGCPKLPVQTSVALYLSKKLRDKDIDVMIAGTDAAINLLKVADPDGHYIDNCINLDRCIEDVAEKRVSFDLTFVFVHNDANISYAATVNKLMNTKLFLIIFGENTKELVQSVDFECDKIIAATTHNPVPLKNKIDRLME